MRVNIYVGLGPQLRLMFLKSLLGLLLLLLLLIFLWGGSSGGYCDRHAFKSPEAENSVQSVCRKVCEICVMKSTRPVRDPVPVGACMLHEQGATEL